MKKAQAIKVTVLTVSALGMGYAFGYLDGSGASHPTATVGRFALGAILLVILAVLAKIIAAVLFGRSGGPSSGGGGNGPRPPQAPVPRPGGGRPPSRSAAVELRAGSNV
jgi:hypothetical protein